MSDSPQFLVEWSSPWREFVSAIRPAFRRSPPRLRHEARAGLFPVRGLAVALLLEAAALAAAIVHPYDRIKFVVLEESRPSHDVIYFSPDELPRTRDLGGAASGTAGRSGGTSGRRLASRAGPTPSTRGPRLSPRFPTGIQTTGSWTRQELMKIPSAWPSWNSRTCLS